MVLPIDGNGKLYVTGKYPQLNKKLERTGKYSDLARKSNEYTDYIYKNQYSAVAESRKLNGSKTWDGYYLSYAKGYVIGTHLNTGHIHSHIVWNSVSRIDGKNTTATAKAM